MPYEHIPGITVNLLDGGLRTVVSSNQPRILILGPAESGETNRIFTVSDLAELNREFGSTSKLAQKAHEAVGEGADRISVMRIGGRTGIVEIEDSASGATLQIVPALRDNEVLERYSLVITTNADGNVRILIWDLVDGEWAYDSDEVHVLADERFEITLTGTWSDTQLCGSYAFPSDSTQTPAFADLDDAAMWGSHGDLTFTLTNGQDGNDMSWVELYAAFEEAYQSLDYREGDIVIPVGVYFDVPNIAEQDDGSHWEADTGTAVHTPDFSSLPSSTDTISNVLGWLWQYQYRGHVYTYFTDARFFDWSLTASLEHSGGGAFTVLSVETGPGAKPIFIEIVGGATMGSAYAAIVTTDTEHTITVTIEDGVTTSDTIVAELTGTMSDYVTATVDTSGPMAAASIELVLAGHYLTHEDLTGDYTPDAVHAKFLAGNNNQLREANFGHQLASFCHRSSVQWKDMLGVISVKPLSGVGVPRISPFSRREISEWAGELPELSSFGTKMGVDSASDNGNGLLGNKFIGGASGYRYAGLDGYGDATDGLSFGGFGLTKGLSLPNEGSWVYGVAPNDEILDSVGNPVDIGKHIFVTYDYPIITNGFNSGLAYRSTMEAAFAGKLAVTPENAEPIGPINGTFRTLSVPLKMAPTLSNALSSARVIGLLDDSRSGARRVTLVSCRTFAHPDTDYTRLSTIRCVNRHVRGIRNLAMPFIGQAFNSLTLTSLQQAIDGYLTSEKRAGFNSGAVARILYTRADRVAGRLNVELRLVPPFTLETITIRISLAAEESGLQEK